MERIEFWRKELQGAHLYDGRTRTVLVGSKICDKMTFARRGTTK
jgi:hypothetical protein